MSETTYDRLSRKGQRRARTVRTIEDILIGAGLVLAGYAAAWVTWAVIRLIERV